MGELELEEEEIGKNNLLVKQLILDLLMVTCFVLVGEARHDGDKGCHVLIFASALQKAPDGSQQFHCRSIAVSSADDACGSRRY